jgi:hypothetical protein
MNSEAHEKNKKQYCRDALSELPHIFVGHCSPVVDCIFSLGTLYIERKIRCMP